MIKLDCPICLESFSQQDLRILHSKESVEQRVHALCISCLADLATFAMAENPDLTLDLKCPECRKIFYIALPDVRVVEKKNKNLYLTSIKSFFISLVFLGQYRLIGQNAEFLLINQYIHTILLSLIHSQDQPVLDIAAISVMQFFINPLYAPLQNVLFANVSRRLSLLCSETFIVSTAAVLAQAARNQRVKLNQIAMLVRHFTSFYLASLLIDNACTFFSKNFYMDIFPENYEKKMMGTGFVVQYLICMSFLFMTALGLNGAKSVVKPLSKDRIQLLMTQERVLIFED
jgi:hypothetical protein